METKWFTIFTRPGRELSVARALTNKKIINYCPLKKVVSDNKEKYAYTAPLFKSYVFVKIEEKRLYELKSINGVINFLYCMNKPALIDESDIDTIKKVTGEYPYLNIEKTLLNDSSSNAGINSHRPAGKRIPLPSLCCNIVVSETAPEAVTSKPLYSIKLLKRLQYTFRALLAICIEQF